MAERKVVVAAVQAAPVFLDRDETTAKACELIGEAASRGAQLALFPEAFIPAYPDWVWVVPGGKRAVHDELYRELVEQAVEIPGETTDRLCRAAEEAGIHVAIGVNERNVEASGASLYNTLVYIDASGELLGKHQKLVPTAAERLIWAQGDGRTLSSFDTAVGKIAGLICWENYMPLARNAFYLRGTEIHLAPTWDSSESWLIAMRHIANEGGMFVINCCQAMRLDTIPERYEFKSLYPDEREWVNKGNSCIIDPRGRVVAGPVEAEETILTAELDLASIAEAKRMFDVAGHYARPDVFQFAVKEP